MKVVEDGLPQGDNRVLVMRDGLGPPYHGHLTAARCGTGDVMSQSSRLGCWR